MARRILTNQDLSGQTLVGQPFSYIGNCTGSDVHFTGDWRFCSLYRNNLVRPDWSQAQTWRSYSVLSAYTDPVLPADLDDANFDLMVALFRQQRPALTVAQRNGVDLVINELDAQTALERWGRYSWGSLAPRVRAAFTTEARAVAAFTKAVGGRTAMVERFKLCMYNDPARLSWDDSRDPQAPDGGVLSSDWGIVARNAGDGRLYATRWQDFPALARPHDRLELAEKLEAEILAATGQAVTIYVQSCRPWRAVVGGKEQSREELAPR